MIEIQVIMRKILSAGTLALILCLITYPFYIKYMKLKSFGQQIRKEGPENHHIKKDTPTMGGLVIVLIALAVAWIFLGQYMTRNMIAFTGMVVTGLLLGLTDDLSKITKKESLGLRARDKLVIQIVMGCLLVFFINRFTPITTETIVPLLGITIDSKLFYLIFTLIVLCGTTNAVNLTDGLDGLAAGICAICFFTYMVICYKNEQFDLAIVSFAFTCACLGFLWFNAYPAKIFMGDTGSLALGTALGTLAVFTKTEFLLLIIGGVFVAEALSVIIQVSYLDRKSVV